MVLTAVAALTLAGTSYALDYDYSGHLPNHNDTLTYSFTTNGTSTVTLFSSSWDDGNFDPMLGLWDSNGDLIQFQDDGNEIGTTFSNGVAYGYREWDSYFTEVLNAGTYFVTLSTFFNNHAGNNLSDGFVYDNEVPIPITQWDQPFNRIRGDYYEFHILGVEEARDVNNPVPEPVNNPVPEPSTIILLGAGLAGLGLARRRSKKLA
ncbi:MAG TPA: PEP-CTERM sorting domain-containing protein [Geobacter sp.]|nr:PEP-CTERM sorting domain-containing protein [Geobacter sp.]